MSRDDTCWCEPLPGDAFYKSAEWRALRRAALRRDGYRCVVCRRDVSAKGASRVDHILTRKARPDLALVLANVRTLCPTHDNQGHREKAGGGGDRVETFVVGGCDADGWPLDPKRP